MDIFIIMTKLAPVPDALGEIHLTPLGAIIHRVAIYGVYSKNGTVLMVKDTQSKQWEFPGGGIEVGESEIDALKRELYEETGLSLNDVALDPINLISSTEELFYDLPSQEAWLTRRKFYLIFNLSGILSADGNGSDVTEVSFRKIHSLKNSVSLTINGVINKMVDL